jgi:hypothetical protein
MSEELTIIEDRIRLLEKTLTSASNEMESMQSAFPNGDRRWKHCRALVIEWRAIVNAKS